MKGQAVAGNIELTDAVTTRSCDHCHALLLPGTTASSRLVAKRGQPRMKITLDTAADEGVDVETTEGGGIAAPKGKGAGNSSRRRNWRVRRRHKNCTKLVSTCHACGHGNALPTSERPKAKSAKEQAAAAAEATTAAAVAAQTAATKTAAAEEPQATPEPSQAPRRFSFSAEPTGSAGLSGAQRLAQASAQATPKSKHGGGGNPSRGVTGKRSPSEPPYKTPGAKKGRSVDPFKSQQESEGKPKKKKKTRKSGGGEDLLQYVAAASTPARGGGGSAKKAGGSSLADFLGSL